MDGTSDANLKESREPRSHTFSYVSGKRRAQDRDREVDREVAGRTADSSTKREV